MRDCAALHLAGNTALKEGENSVLFILGCDEAVARAYRAEEHLTCFFLGDVGECAHRAFVCLKEDFVDAGNQTDRIAEGRGIHIILHGVFGDDNIAGGKARRKRTCDTRIDDEVGGVFQNHSLGGDRCRNLADARAHEHTADTLDFAEHKEKFSHLLISSVFHSCPKRGYLNLHRADNS